MDIIQFLFGVNNVIFRLAARKEVKEVPMEMMQDAAKEGFCWPWRATIAVYLKQTQKGLEHRGCLAK